MSGSSQKFIAKNRAPRVQIEYDVELYGAEKKVVSPKWSSPALPIASSLRLTLITLTIA